jgi:hypothetical protein
MCVNEFGYENFCAAQLSRESNSGRRSLRRHPIERDDPENMNVRGWKTRKS